MKEKLQTIPFFVWLLPVFFVIHGFVEYLGFASFENLVPMLLTYLTSASILYLLFFLLYKNSRKAGLLTFFLLFTYLFFGAIFDFLKANSPVKALYKYSVLLSLMLIAAIILSIYLHRTIHQLKKTTYFLNLLLVIFLIFDMGTGLWKTFNKEKQLWKGPANLASGIIPDSCIKPDIYLLLFDAYSSTYGLNKIFGFDNRELDSFLTGRNFHLLPPSRSNYTATPFSMASMFNMDYLYWLDARDTVKHKDYLRSAGLIYENETMRVLQKNGYEIVNASIFDIRDYPSPINNAWKAHNASLLREGTLGVRLLNQFHWWLERHPKLNRFLPFVIYEDNGAATEISLQRVLKESSRKATVPRFIYGHFLMPHAPFYFDKDGKPRSQQERHNKIFQEGPDNIYTGYVQYTNKILKNLIDTIQSNSGGNAVILLMSDHGYRSKLPDDRKKYLWNNLNAVYYPNQNYQCFTSLKDSVSNVNQFRILFNTLFHQQYSLLKDSFMVIYD